MIEDPQERLAALMSRAKKWRVPTSDQLIDAYRVHGCQSAVWLVPTVENGLCQFAMESDAPMVKGIVALLCELYDSAPAKEIMEVEPTLFDDLGFTRQLSPTRLNGLAAVRGAIRAFAAAQL